jgi:hypothetical protein
MAAKKGAREVTPAHNPFFRGDEREFIGGEKTITSPVASVFSHDYVRKRPGNAIDDALHEQGIGTSKKTVSRGPSK